jgi:hypothetical protein
MSFAGHGPNIGHGFVKYVIIDDNGVELPPAVFPAMIGRAASGVAGAIAQAEVVDFGGVSWWTGEDALLAPAPLTILAQERLHDPAFIPALVRGAVQRLGALNGASGGACVSGLPATWATDIAKARRLGEHLRAAYSGYTGIRVIPEPLGLLYAVALDAQGQVAGDPSLRDGQVAVVDLGHHTVDIAVLRRLVPIPTSLDTYALGTARPLTAVRARLSAAVERELTLFETDLAVRDGAVLVAGRLRELPRGWDRPLIESGEAIVARLVEAWGSGTQFDAVLVGGGGAEVPQIVYAIRERFPHAEIVPQPQTAIARGYARLARRIALGHAG